MKKAFKLLLLMILAGASKLWNFLFPRSQVVVLMYHSVGDSGWEFSITPEKLEKQISYLHKRGYKFLTAEEFQEIISGQTDTVQKGVLLTFDDGYQDTLTRAVPILKKYNLPALIFMHSNRSADRLRNDLPLLSWAEIRQLASDYNIGSHSHSHPDLKSLSEEELTNELSTAETVFMREIGHKPVWFSYPGGRLNEKVMLALKKRGYQLAFTINPGLVVVGSNPLAVPRFGVSVNTTMVEFRARVTGTSDWYEKLANLFRQKKKIYNYENYQ